jgi:hypothetical protein
MEEETPYDPNEPVADDGCFSEGLQIFGSCLGSIIVLAAIVWGCLILLKACTWRDFSRVDWWPF